MSRRIKAVASLACELRGEGNRPDDRGCCEPGAGRRRRPCAPQTCGHCPADEKRSYERRAEVHAARASPATPQLPLAAYAGNFGVRTVKIENGQLIYERQGGIRSPLLPLGGNRFALDENPDTRVEFSVNEAAAVSFDLVQSDGSRTTVPRGPAPA